MTPDQTRDECDDLAAILHPSPPPLRLHADDAEHEAFQQSWTAVQRERATTAAQLRAEVSPVLSTLTEQARIKADADRKIREVIAYAREFVAPRPYTLETLAAVVGTSYSAVRGAFDHHDVEAVAEATGRRHTLNQQHADDGALEQLVADLEETSAPPARAFVAAVAAVLHAQGWTPYPPVARTANPRTARRYIRWERRWSNGTKVGLYQEPTGVLSTHARMPRSDARHFHWENDDEGAAAALAGELALYAERVARHDAEQATAPVVLSDEVTSIQPIDVGPLMKENRG